MALLVSAGLFIKSLINVTPRRSRVKIDNVVTFGVSPELNGYTPERSRQFFERVEDELAALPGVTARHRVARSAPRRQQLGQPTSA